MRTGSEAPQLSVALLHTLVTASFVETFMRQPPDNIIHTGQASRSALRVASLRAVHQLLDDPLVLADPLALPLLGAQTEASLREDPFVLNDPLSRGLRASLVVRSRLAEDELARGVAAGIRQYVLLGAGLDTFAYRNVHRALGLQVFEVDHPATQAWKRQSLHGAEIEVPKTTTFVPVDVEQSTLAEGLAQAGFRPDQPACLAWLGVTVYLTREAVLDTLRFVTSLAAGSSVTFDYAVPAATLSPIDRAIRNHLEQQITELGEPWISFFEPTELQASLRQLGFRSVRDFGAEELNGLYLARRKDGLRTGGSFRMMVAGL
jgi:methyltransferase (TIGR00027 family)